MGRDAVASPFRARCVAERLSQPISPEWKAGLCCGGGVRFGCGGGESEDDLVTSLASPSPQVGLTMNPDSRRVGESSVGRPWVAADWPVICR